MPSLGADMEAGTLVSWKKPIGAFVKRGEILAEVETDKGVIAVESFHEGVVARYLVEVGSKVPVGTKLAILDESATGATARSESAETPSAQAAAPMPSAAPVESAPPIVEPPVVPTAPTTHVDFEPVPLASLPDDVLMTISARALVRERGLDPHGVRGTGPHGVVTRGDVIHAAEAPGRVRVTPFALRRAAELGIPLSTLVATGSDGAIVAADVERAAAAVVAHELPAPRPTPPAAQPVEVEPKLSSEQRMRRAIGAAMSRSKREIPHYYVAHTIDLGPALERLAKHNASVSMNERILPAVLLLESVILALKKVPELNARCIGELAPPIEEVNLGVAISLRKGGLIAPAIMGAERKTLAEIMAALDDLVLRSRSSGLTATEMSGASITVTSLGDRGVESLYPIIHPPQVAMVGFGKIVTRPWVVGDAVVPRPVVTATLAADHRFSDGHRGGLFLAAIEAALLSPDALFTANAGDKS